jgi:hypothetical protein
MTIECLLHVHSSFSYDSQTDLADIARIAKRHGIGCVLMSEHNNRLDPEQVTAFVQRCEDLSDDELLIVPGLELAWDANRVHLLAYGVRRFIESTGAGCTVRSLIDAVHESGGIAVLAHPSHRQAVERLTDDDLARLDGIEVWNVKNGNPYVPAWPDVALLNRVRMTGGRAFAFGGLDWHHLNKFSRFTLAVEAPELTQDVVFRALLAGRFTVHGRYVSVPARGETRRARLLTYRLISDVFTLARRTAYRCQSALERRGLKVPKALTAVARRVF